jgi:hypothetical protein
MKSQKFVKLAEKHPNYPIAVNALIKAVWQVNATPWPVELVGPPRITLLVGATRKSFRPESRRPPSG